MKSKDQGGLKVIRIPIPKPKQKGWRLMDVQGKELIYIRRSWEKTITSAKGRKKLKMEKPEKKFVIYPIDREDLGYNHAIDDFEKYHLWDIKTNYIHKDKLPREKDLRFLFNGIIDWGIHTKMKTKDIVEKLFTELSNQLKG